MKKFFVKDDSMLPCIKYANKVFFHFDWNFHKLFIALKIRPLKSLTWSLYRHVPYISSEASFSHNGCTANANLTIKMVKSILRNIFDNDNW